MTQGERLQVVALIGFFILAGLAINHGADLLRKPPESPEMAKAKAEAFLMQTEADLQYAAMKNSIKVGIVSVLSAVVFCFVSLFLAIKFVQMIQGNIAVQYNASQRALRPKMKELN